MSKLEDLKKELLPLILKHACLKLDQPIKLSSGKMSQVYFDGRRITLHPKGITLFARAILELAKRPSARMKRARRNAGPREAEAVVARR